MTATATATTQADLSSLESRLTALEIKLGVTATTTTVATASTGTAKTKDDDIASRLTKLQQTMDRHTTTDFRELQKEIRNLLQELDPGTGLTHQQQPLLYKRQEILASADSFSEDMKCLANILHLLVTSQGKSDAAGTDAATSLREDQVTQAPILVGIHVDPDHQRRLDALRLSVEDINVRTRKLSLQLNEILECYHAVLFAASEKCVLANEVIDNAIQTKQQQQQG